MPGLPEPGLPRPRGAVSLGAPMAEPPVPAHAPAVAVTELLRQLAGGDRSALDRLYTALYPDLKRVARARLHTTGRADGSLHTTTLVHETFLHLVARHELQLTDRRHFFAYAARTMRHIIVDEARAGLADRRGGGAEHVTLSAADDVLGAGSGEELLAVHVALTKLEALDPELAEVVELRYFGGYEDQEIASQLGISDRTVRRRWDKARAWLLMALGDTAPGG